MFGYESVQEYYRCPQTACLPWPGTEVPLTRGAPGGQMTAAYTAAKHAHAADYDKLFSVDLPYVCVCVDCRDASTADAIPHIKVPTLCISAGDDPIALAENLPLEAVAQSSTAALAFTAHGGHIGWPHAYTDSRAVWAEDATLQFLFAALSEERPVSAENTADAQYQS